MCVCLCVSVFFLMIKNGIVNVCVKKKEKEQI